MELGTAYCTRCERNRPEEDFSPSQAKRGRGWCRECHNGHRRDKRAGKTPKRLFDVCQHPDCHKSLAGRRSHARYCSVTCSTGAWRVANPELNRGYYVKYTYGLTQGELDALLLKQNGTCAICDEAPATGLVVDHNHDTGAVRGLLCDPCNKGLGAFRDSVANLLRALHYLRTS